MIQITGKQDSQGSKSRAAATPDEGKKGAGRPPRRTVDDPERGHTGGAIE